ncbi:FimD/PapC N-terminal domain-containing protein, partial [Proteus vulgaris]
MKMNKICISLFLYLGYTASLYANSSNLDNVYFDPDFLELPNKSTIDLSHFENNEQLAGTYYVDVYVNTDLISTENIKFEKKDNGNLIPC